MDAAPLLTAADPRPVATENEAGRSAMLFASDHAGRAIPRALGNLGLADEDLSRHIAWDIGIRAVTSEIARRLDAPFVFQRYSRLVIDCNRRPGTAPSIPETSDGTPIPDNRQLSACQIRAREAEILTPYQAEIGRLLGERAEQGRATVLFAMHSYTPRLVTAPAPTRPWEIGILANEDWRVGDALIALLEAETGFTVGRNQPYSVNAEEDYTIPIHAEEAGLPYVEIGIRQDLIEAPEGQGSWARLCAELFPRAVALSGVLGE